jgi:hypothetical protein
MYQEKDAKSMGICYIESNEWFGGYFRIDKKWIMRSKQLSLQESLRSVRHADIRTVFIPCSEGKTALRGGFLSVPPATAYLISDILFRAMYKPSLITPGNVFCPPG